MKHRKQNVNMNNRRELLEFKILRQSKQLPIERYNLHKAHKVLLSSFLGSKISKVKGMKILVYNHVIGYWGKKISLKATNLMLESCC